MEDRRKLMKNAHGQSDGDFIKLDIATRLEVKQAPENKGAAFRFYKNEESIYVTKTISGIYVGDANIMTAYDDDLGTKGGTYFTTPYFTIKDSVVVLAPSKKGGVEAAFRGTVVEAESWISANSTSGRPTKRKLVYLLTKSGLITVQTNMVIFIDQIKHIKELLFDNLLDMTPATYDSKNPGISKKAQDILGKFAAKNPPNYASMCVGQPLTDEFWLQCNAQEVFETFVKWKAQTTDVTKKVTEVEPEEELPMPTSRFTREESSPKNTNVDYDAADRDAITLRAAKPLPKALEEMPEDDLPF